MIQENYLVKIEKLALPDSIHAAVLDEPAAGLMHEATKNLQLKGWVLACDESSDVCLLLVDATGEKVIQLNQQRQDVLKKVAKINEPSEQQSRVGFLFDLPFTTQVQIFIAVGTERFLWQCISFEPIAHALTLQIPAWHEYVTSGRVISGLLHDESVRMSIESGTSIFPDINSLLQNAGKMSPEQKKWLKKFQSYVNNYAFIKDMANCWEAGIRSPRCGGIAHIRHGALRGAANILEFKDDAGLFYLIQYVSSCDALYFPDIDAYVILQHATPAMFSALIDAVFSVFIPAAQAGGRANCAGYMFGFSRPYHFLYDMMPAVDLAFRSNWLADKMDLWRIPGGDFLDLGDLYEKKVRHISDLQEKNNYVILLGVPFLSSVVTRDQEKLSQVAALDTHLIESLAKQAPQSIELLDQASKVVWLGITSQKRKWISQEDSLVTIIISVLNHWPDACFVFDGWTLPHTPENNDLKEIKSDRRVMNSVLCKIKKPVSSIDLVGAFMEEKIRVASRVDFFIANYLTGSMIVGRVCGKPGLGHISNAGSILGEHQHMHIQTTKVPADKIIDFVSSENKTPDAVDYDFDVEFVLDWIKTH